MIRSAPRALTALAVALALAACSSKPDPDSFGGRLALEGGEVAAIGADWNAAQARIEKGRALVESGKDRIDRGESQIAKGRKAVDRGEDELRQGRRMVEEGRAASLAAEETYRRVTAAKARTVVPQ